jgi:hypothetical protein
MALTKVSAGVIAANAVVDSFGTQSITGDKIGLTAINANNIVTGAVTGDKLGATSINANNIVDGTITNAKIDTVANTKLTGTITATQMAANSVNSTILQTNSIENYMATSGRPLSNRNLIINGAMQIAQRNTSVTGITTSGYYTADRWLLSFNSAGTWTMNVESSAPANTEFRKSANVICTTADSSLAAGDYFIFEHRIEGQNVQGIKKGTSAAESLTVSFWVKSSNTGTYICELYDADNTRQISKSYTIDAADTWEKKTITMPPDITGQFANDNGLSLVLDFWLAAGTNFTSGTLNDTAWASVTSANRAVGLLNLANATGNYFAWTGVQLEIGTVATPYEWLDYGTELLKCYRYFYIFRNDQTGTFGNIGNAVGLTNTTQQPQIALPFPMRTTPSMILSALSHLALHTPGNARQATTALSIVDSQSGPSRLVLASTTASDGSFTAGRVMHFEFNNSSTGWIGFTAEL